MGEDPLADRRRQVPPLLGVAGLEDHRPALGRTLDVERPGHREVLADVVQLVLAGRVEEDAGLLVAREGVVLVGVPEALRHLHVLERAPVAGGVVEVVLPVVVLRRPLVDAGDDVPAGAAAADQIERGDLAGDVERLGVGGRDRRDQADLLGRGGDRRQQGQRLEPAEEVGRGLGGDELAVGDEDEVEAGRLGLLGAGDVPPDVDAGVTGDLRIEPGVLLPLAADAVQDRAEFQLSIAHVNKVRRIWFNRP